MTNEQEIMKRFEYGYKCPNNRECGNVIFDTDVKSVQTKHGGMHSEPEYTETCPYCGSYLDENKKGWIEKETLNWYPADVFERLVRIIFEIIPRDAFAWQLVAIKMNIKTATPVWCRQTYREIRRNHEPFELPEAQRKEIESRNQLAKQKVVCQ